MTSKAILLFLTFSILSGCGNLKIHDSLICTTAGLVEAGANCTRAVSGIKTQISFDEFIEMLEPSESHGPAVIIPLDDFVEIKKIIEIACVYMKCSKKKQKKILNNIEGIINNAN